MDEDGQETRTSADVRSEMEEEEEKKVVVVFRSAGDAPVLRQNRFKVGVRGTFARIVQLLCKQIQKESVLVYLDSSFMPSLEDNIADLVEVEEAAEEGRDGKMEDLMEQVDAKQETKGETKEEKDLEMGTDPFHGMEGDSKEELVEEEEDAFFSTINEAQKKIRTIRQKLDVLKQTHREIKMATSTEQVKGLRDNMRVEVATVSQTAAQVKKMLDGLAIMTKEEEEGKGPAKQRMRTSMVAAMRKKLKVTLREFSNLRTQMSEDYREVVDRRYETITGEKASDAMLEHMIETGESESIFQKAILDQGGNFSETINEIKERHDAVVEVERGLLELHQIFLDMATLVEQQGEMIDNIESQVARASTFTAQGTEVLRDTKTLHKKIKRKQLCLALIVVAIIAAIAIAIILTVR
eukprot:jgi/Pico_ML_1/52165/g375.t1